MKRAKRNRPKKTGYNRQGSSRKHLLGLFDQYLAGVRENEADAAFEVAYKIFAKTSKPEAAGLAFQAAMKMPNASVAADVFSRIAHLARGNADIQNDFGALLCKSERFEEAETVLRQTLRLSPDDGQVLFNMGQALLGQEKFPEAEKFFLNAIEANFSVSVVFSGLGEALKRQGLLEESIEYFRKAFHQDRSNSDIRNQFEQVLWDSGNAFPELERLYVADLVNDSEKFGSAMQLACVYAATDRRSRAKPIIDRWLLKQDSLKIEDQARLREILSELQCLEGDFRNAMLNYHWRLKRWKRWDDNLSQPEWLGQPLEGRSILVFAEQGIGDQVMFMSLLPDLIRICDNIFVECDARLVRLFQRSFPAVDFLPVINSDRIEIGDRDPDFQIAMGSLGCWLWDDFERRNKSSYLSADEMLTNSIKKRYRRQGDEILIGISWTSPLGKFPGLKSLELNDLTPLFKLQNAIIVDLQYGDTAEERGRLEQCSQFSLLHDEAINQLEDIDAFTCQVAAMDVVVTVSNSVAHISGALGIPTIVLLPFAPQWKWSGNSMASVWYPEVYLVRRKIEETIESQVDKAVHLIAEKCGNNVTL